MVFIVCFCNCFCISCTCVCVLLIAGECVLLSVHMCVRACVCECVCVSVCVSVLFLWIPIKCSSALAQSCCVWIIFLMVNGERVCASLCVCVCVFEQKCLCEVHQCVVNICLMLGVASLTFSPCARVLCVHTCQPPPQATDGE